MRALAALTRTLGPAVEAGWDQVAEEPCPACNGEGSHLALDHERTRPWHWEPTHSEFPCEDCCGTGRAPRVVFTIRPAEPLVDAPKTQEPVIPTEGDSCDEEPLPF